MRDGHEGEAVFNIGTQNAGAVYMVGGDQYIEHAEGVLSIEARALSELRAAVAAAAPSLSDRDRKRVEESIDVVDTELRRPQPDRARVAERLARVAKILKQAGELATSAAALHQLAGWLGPAGVSLLQALV